MACHDNMKLDTEKPSLLWKKRIALLPWPIQSQVRNNRFGEVHVNLYLIHWILNVIFFNPLKELITQDFYGLKINLNESWILNHRLLSQFCRLMAIKLLATLSKNALFTVPGYILYNVLHRHLLEYIQHN